jgi:hypothetical protein
LVRNARQRQLGVSRLAAEVGIPKTTTHGLLEHGDIDRMTPRE